MQIINKARDFANIFRLYRRHGNGLKHSAKAAWNIAIIGTPF